MEQHLDMGGTDDPAEVLLTFFFRYGGVKHSNTKISTSCRTHLSQDKVIQTEDGGSADMNSSFQIENCVTIFESCWQILQKRLKGNSDQRFSILQYMIDADKLKQGRSQCKTTVEKKLREVLDGRRNERSFSNSSNASRIPGLPRVEKKDASGDLEARDLIRGYGQSFERFMPFSKKRKRSVEESSKKKKKPKKTKKKKPPKVDESSKKRKKPTTTTKKKRPKVVSR